MNTLVGHGNLVQILLVIIVLANRGLQVLRNRLGDNLIEKGVSLRKLQVGVG